MASFNQSPAGQTSLALPAYGFGLLSNSGGTTETGASVLLDGSTSATLSFTGVAIPDAPTGFYPTYRRPNRVVTAL